MVRGYVAVAEQRATDTISLENLFADVTAELMAWNRVIVPATTVALFAQPPPLSDIQRRLRTLWGAVWTDRWLKAPAKKRVVTPKQHQRTHGSVYRILQAHRRQAPEKKRLQ